jgi:hypothetical protein
MLQEHSSGVLAPRLSRRDSEHVSSNDRTPRRKPTPPAAAPSQADSIFHEEDVYYGGDWRDERTSEEDVVDYGQAAPRQPSTAAGLNRLRQSIGRSSASSASQQPASRQSKRRPAEAPRYADDERRTGEDQRTSRQQQASVAQSRPPQARRAAEPIERVEDNYDPYVEYDDDFTEYDAPRRTARPRSPVSMPSIRRPTMPSAIAQAELVSDVPALSLVGASIVSLVAMSIVVGNQASSLAPEFATHVSASGLLEDFRSDSALWRLPLISLAFTLMNLVIAWFTAPIDRFASRFVIAAALIVQVIAWVAVIRIL